MLTLNAVEHDTRALTRSAVPCLGLFAVFLGLYLAVSPSLAHQHWDSLEYAYACETRGPRAMWGNHPLGHPVQCGVFVLARALGYEGRALPVLKAVNAAAAAAAVGGFALVLAAILGIARWRAAGWALVLGSGYGFWRFAGSADIYSLSLLLLIAAFGAMVWSCDRPSVASSMLAGVLVGLATLSHQLAGVILIAGAVGLVPLLRAGVASGNQSMASGSQTVTSGFSRQIWSFLLTAAATVMLGYLALGFAATGSSSPARLLGWARGYAGDPTYGRYLNLTGLGYAVWAVGETLMKRTEWWPLELARRILAGLAILMPFACAPMIRHVRGRSRTIARSCALQCAIAWILVLMWEPGLVGKFWLLTLPAAILWLEYASQGAAVRFTRLRGALRAAPLVLAGLVLAYNAWVAMAAERRPDAVFEQSLSLWIEHSTLDDVLIENGRFTAHLRFWGQRRGVVNLYRTLQNGGTAGPFAELRRTIEEADLDGRQVLFAPGLSSYFTEDRLSIVGTTREELVRFFEGYRWEGPLFEYRESGHGPVKQVFRLKGS
jgi:hypothetical protein